MNILLLAIGICSISFSNLEICGPPLPPIPKLPSIPSSPIDLNKKQKVDHPKLADLPEIKKEERIKETESIIIKEAETKAIKEAEDKIIKDVIVNDTAKKIENQITKLNGGESAFKMFIGFIAALVITAITMSCFSVKTSN